MGSFVKSTWFIPISLGLLAFVGSSVLTYLTGSFSVGGSVALGAIILVTGLVLSKARAESQPARVSDGETHKEARKS